MGDWLFRALASAGMVLSLAGNAPAAEPPLEVSSFGLQAISLTPPTAKVLAQGISAEGWRTAQPRDSSRLWNELPPGSPPAQWLSVVTVGFNGQADAYAFMFNGPDGALSLASHIPFRQVWMQNETMAWIWPQDELLGAVRVQLRAPQRAALRPVTFRVVPWRQEASKKPPAESTNLEEARATDPKRVFDGVSVIAHGAAVEAGWAPTTAKTARTATCEVRVEDQTCSFRLTLEDASGKRVTTKERVSCEAYHDHLVRLFRFAEQNTGVSDFTQLKRGHLELLAADGPRLAVLVNQELTVFDLQAGKRLWTTETPASSRRPSDRYTAGLTPQGSPALLQFAGELASFDWTTGGRTPIAQGGSEGANRLDGKAKEWAFARGGQLSLVRDRAVVWSEKQSDAITAGPLLAGNNVHCGDAAGNVIARSLGDAALRWKRTGLGRLHGRLVASGGLILAFATDTAALIALSAADGQEVWRQAVGDVLLQEPIVLADQLLVATKSNHLLLLDAKTGAVLVKRQWPTWLLRVTPITSPGQRLLACTDIAGKVSLLSLKDLATQKTFELSAELTGRVVYFEQLSPGWPVERTPSQQDDLLTEIESTAPKKGPTLLVADTQGFLYFLPLKSE